MFDWNEWRQGKGSPTGDRSFPLDVSDLDTLADHHRDSVHAHVSDEHEPAIVSISDVHAYLDSARSALLTLADHPDFDPVVTEDAEGVLHWADNDYVLVFNGDLIDRGPDNIDTIELVLRLIAEAPPGRVRYLLGNHEMGILTPSEFNWGSIYSLEVSIDGRQRLLDAIQEGYIVASYEGYNFTYAHAGQNDLYSVETVNESLIAAADKLSVALGSENDTPTQSRLLDEYSRIFGLGPPHGRGKGAGLLWLDFKHLQPDAPPQIVGHSRQDEIIRHGQVICENVIRNTRESPGGEAVVVETPDECKSVQRCHDNTVSVRSL